MTQIRRPAPDLEWVQMYRQGIPTQRIAAGAGVAETTIRYHLAIAAKQDPKLRPAHEAALPPVPPQLTAADRWSLDDVLAFYTVKGRLPVHHRAQRESALAGWLVRRRKEAENGSLSPAYADVLDAIPGWRTYPTKRDADAARWK